jgi:MFS superfamily sulfate permease-like transporter
VTVVLALRQYVPLLDWASGYRRRWLLRDVVAGLSAGAIVIPQAMAYASIAGLPAQAGLYTCLIPALGYVLLGGSRVLSFTTTSTIAVLTASTLQVADFPGGPRTEDVATLVCLVGIFLLAARVLRLASLVENISDALLVGLKIGVGMTVLVGQLPNLLGIPAKSGSTHFFSGLAYVLSHLDRTSVTTLCFGGGALIALIALKRVVPRFPGPLVVVVGSIVVSYLVDPPHHGVHLIAKVPSGLPRPVLPSFDRAGALIPGALAIALMAFLETVSVARSMRVAGEPPVDSD